MPDSSDDIGPGRPPKHSQFKKGQSGNPKGRKKKTLIDDLRPIIADVFERPVRVSDGDKETTMSNMQVMLEAQRRSALTGNLRSIEALFKKAHKCGLVSEAKPRSGIILTDPIGDNGHVVRMFRLEQDAMRKPARYDPNFLRVWGQR
jgi:hypothetical protein